MGLFFSPCLVPSVWSFGGPVWEEEVGPDFLVQSKSSVVSWVKPHILGSSNVQPELDPKHIWGKKRKRTFMFSTALKSDV